jgi:hypothetical protein
MALHGLMLESCYSESSQVHLHETKLATKEDKCWICFSFMNSKKVLVHKIEFCFMISVVEVAVCREVYIEVSRRLNRIRCESVLPMSGRLCVCVA